LTIAVPEIFKDRMDKGKEIVEISAGYAVLLAVDHYLEKCEQRDLLQQRQNRLRIANNILIAGSLCVCIVLIVW
jgi:hypothetical protein